MDPDEDVYDIDKLDSTEYGNTTVNLISEGLIPESKPTTDDDASNDGSVVAKQVYFNSLPENAKQG